MSTRSAQR